jgi:glycosyltransferase involved in cell wall biosynthesis
MRPDSPLLLHVTTSDMSLELLLGPQLRAFMDAGFEVHAASEAGPHVSSLSADGIVFHPLRHATRSRAPHRDAAAMAELYRLFRRVGPVIVHTHNPKPGVYGRIAARLAGVPLIVNTQHGLYAQPTDRLRRRLPVYTLERIAAAFGDVELVQNEEDVTTLRRLRVPSSKLRLLGNGIDLARFHPDDGDRLAVREELGVGPDELLVGAIGRLVREKGIGELLEAAIGLLAERGDVTFVVAGPQEAAKADAVTEAEIRDATAAGVRFLGFRSDPERLYRAFDLFVLASHREGFPRATMEAAATATPIVATDVRGCRQVVTDGVTGLLVPPRDPRALAAAIRTLLDDPAARAAMGARGLERAAAEFDQQRSIERTLDAYRLLDGSRTARGRRGRARGRSAPAHPPGPAAAR